MSIKIALAGNPNCGKTTLFNNLTGSNQYVGNWPGVTVEKKEGKLKGDKDVIIQDLPGIYSLSPYTLEEVVSRTYLVKEKPDAILNIIDGTNIERNLYLTTQLIELGIPVVMAVNMIDLVRKNGDKIDLKKLSSELGCQAVEISALKGEGTEAAAKVAVAAAQKQKAGELPHVFTGSVEHAIAHIEESIQGKVDDRFLRWYAVKLFERDEKVMEELKLDKALADHIDEHIKDCEKEMDDDAESIITNQRYSYINGVVDKAVKKKARVEHLTVSDKIDQIVTNRVLALPIFALVMFLMYSLSMGTSIADGGWAIGTFATDWTNDVLGTAWLVEIPRAALTAGQFVLFADDGVVKVEQDINSLVTYTTDITEPYHKNRVIRLLNTVANDIYQQFSDGYIGVVNNNEQGRMMFKSAIVGYLLDIQANNGIQNFEAEDVTVEPGEAIDAIVVNLAIQPVDSVEKIYVTITVN